MKTTLRLKVERAALCAVLLVGGRELPAASTNLNTTADACLFEYNADNNLGGMIYVVGGVLNAGTACRPLFKFDPAAALPAGATVTAATFSLKIPVARGTGRAFNLHRLLQSWGEGIGAGAGSGQGAPANPGEVTWNSRFHGATLWAAPGGLAGTDFVITPGATATMGTSTLVFSSAAMAADVQAWLNDPGTNFGWLVAIADESVIQTANHIGTREDPANAPVLTVEYSTASPPVAPVIFNAALIDGQIRFSFAGESGRSYTVEFRDSLTTTNWGPLTNIPTLAANTTLHVTNDVTSLERYFRVRVP